MLLDCGAVQADALTVDRLASLEKVSSGVNMEIKLLCIYIGL